MAYEFSWMAGYLREHAGDDIVMIVLGDHQPPALVSGAGASWNVPVHIVTSRPELVRRLEASGFHEGLTPAEPAIGRMHALLPLLLDAFGNRQGPEANTVRLQPTPWPQRETIPGVPSKSASRPGSRSRRATRSSCSTTTTRRWSSWWRSWSWCFRSHLP